MAPASPGGVRGGAEQIAGPPAVDGDFVARNEGSMGRKGELRRGGSLTAI